MASTVCECFSELCSFSGILSTPDLLLCWSSFVRNQCHVGTREFLLLSQTKIGKDWWKIFHFQISLPGQTQKYFALIFHLKDSNLHWLKCLLPLLTFTCLDAMRAHLRIECNVSGSIICLSRSRCFFAIHPCRQGGRWHDLGLSMLFDHSAVWGLRAIFFTRQSFLALMVSAIMSCGYLFCLAVMCNGATFRGAVMTSRMRPPSETLSNAADFMLDAKMQVLSWDVLILLADAQCLCRRWKRWTCWRQKWRAWWNTWMQVMRFGFG